MTELIPSESIVSRIYFIRGKKVMLDRDIAELYGVQTKVLNQAVTRNVRRFPNDFMFRLTRSEKEELVTNCDRLAPLKHSTACPRAFTEHGVAMLSSVLRSDRAVEINIQIMRTFTRLREMLAGHEDLKRKIEEMESRYDEQFRIVFEAIRSLLETEEPPPKKIGFTAREKQKSFGKHKKR